MFKNQIRQQNFHDIKKYIYKVSLLSQMLAWTTNAQILVAKIIRCKINTY